MYELIANLPVPTTLFELTFTIIGFLLGYAWSENLDESILDSDWFKKQHYAVQWFIKGILKFVHHFWIGMLLMIYFPRDSELFWIGLGLFIEDITDYKKIIGWIIDRLQNDIESLRKVLHE